MKALKIARFQVIDSIGPICIYYAIFLLILTLLVGARVNAGASFTSSGLEIASVIFLFVAGLNSFKGSFKFSQANNITRKTFFKGAILGMLPITLAMSIIDLVINRVYNIFVKSPTNFDMIYGAFRDTGMREMASGAIAWVQSNDIFTLLGTITWQFAVYSMFFLMGLLISLIYYRSNKLLKVIISAIPVVLLMLSNISHGFSTSFSWDKVLGFISAAFGWQSRNPYIAMLSFTIIGVIFAAFIYLLARRAVARE